MRKANSKSHPKVVDRTFTSSPPPSPFLQSCHSPRSHHIQSPVTHDTDTGRDNDDYTNTNILTVMRLLAALTVFAMTILFLRTVNGALPVGTSPIVGSTLTDTETLRDPSEGPAAGCIVCKTETPREAMTHPQSSQNTVAPLGHDEDTPAPCTTIIHSHTTMYEACPVTHVQKAFITSFITSTVTESELHTQRYISTVTVTSILTEQVTQITAATSPNPGSLSAELDISGGDSRTCGDSNKINIVVGLCITIIALELFNLIKTDILKAIALWACRNARVWADVWITKAETLLGQQPSRQERAGNRGVGDAQCEDNINEVVQDG